MTIKECMLSEQNILPRWKMGLNPTKKLELPITSETFTIF